MIIKKKLQYYLDHEHVNHPDILYVDIRCKSVFQSGTSHVQSDGNVELFHHEWKLTLPGFVQGQDSEASLIFVHRQKRFHLVKHDF